MPERNPIAAAVPGEHPVVVSHRLLDFNVTLANMLVRDIREGLDLLLQPLRLKAAYRR